MSEKKEKFNPIAQCIVDSLKKRFFGGKFFDFQLCGQILHRRGFVGSDQWSTGDLSLVLRTFHKQVVNDGINVEKIDELLYEFSQQVGLDINRVRRHFWAIDGDYEKIMFSSPKKQSRLESIIADAEKTVEKLIETPPPEEPEEIPEEVPSTEEEEAEEDE